MKFNRNRSRAFSWFLALTLALSAALSTSPAALADDFVHNKAWTTVGSAGTVDDADAGKLVFQGSAVSFPEILPPLPTERTAQVESNALIPLPTQTTSATIRYNVTAVDGLFEPGSELGMTVRFRDDGGWAQVLVRLYEQDIYTGATKLMLTFDSNAVHSFAELPDPWGRSRAPIPSVRLQPEGLFHRSDIDKNQQRHFYQRRKPWFGDH